MQTNDSTEQISDLGLAAALVTCGFKVLATVWDETGRAHFIFESSIKLAKAVEYYWSDTLELKARKYFDNTKMLKARIYAK
jgi:hypothetical protein